MSAINRLLIFDADQCKAQRDSCYETAQKKNGRESQKLADNRVLAGERK
jgi:hypothetical protein